MQYDINNIFNKIISGEVKSDKIYEDDFVIAINDIAPVSSVHVLVIPKVKRKNFEDFVTNESSSTVAHYYDVIAKIAKKLNVSDYRLITNNGDLSGQTVYHFHTHLISGARFKSLI